MKGVKKIRLGAIFSLECKVLIAVSPKQKYAWNTGVTDATQHKRDNSKLDPEHKRSNICVLFICFSATPCRFIVTAIRKIHRHKLINECLLTFEETISLFHRGSSTQINYRTVTRINSYITFSNEFCLYRSYLITSCCNRNNSDDKASPTQA